MALYQLINFQSRVSFLIDNSLKIIDIFVEFGKYLAVYLTGDRVN